MCIRSCRKWVAFALHILFELPVAFGLAAILAACPVRSGETPRKACLSITVSLPAEPRTFLPSLDMAPADFSVLCSGPDGQRIEASSAQTTIRIEALALGTWTISVTAQNQAGTTIAEGSRSVQLVDEGDTEVTIPLEPLSGNGSLELAAQWLASSIPSPSIEASLQSPTGNLIPVTFTISGAEGTCAIHDLPAGYYTLLIALLNSGSRLAGATEVVRILKDQTTTGTFDFTDLATAQGSVRIVIAPQLHDPLLVQIAGIQAEMGLGRTLVLKPLLTEECVGLKSMWYMDGSIRSQEGTVSMGSDLSLGVHRIDLAVFSPDNARAGSSSFRLRVLASFPPGSLSLSTIFKDAAGGVDGLNACRSVALSADGSSLYAAGYGDNAIACFSRDAQTGALLFKGQYRNGVGGVSGLAGVDSIALSPDGALLYATGYTDNSIVAFTRDTGTGALFFIGCVKNGEQGVDGLAGARGLCVSPDGRHLYCTGYSTGTLLAFEIAASSGALTLLQCLRDGEGDITALEGACSVTAAPDGSQIFVASYNDDSLLVLNRDPSTGLLSLSQVFSDGQAACDGLNGASCVCVSPDGRNLYVTGYYDNALAVFSRDASTCLVMYRGFFKDGMDGVDGLYYARGVSVSLDGKTLYATGSADDAVVFFERDPATGGLTYRSFTSGIDGARGIAVSPDGRNCYVAGTGANQLAVFNRTME
jgi:6-phosphogluconolactonase (cycloisomerase 2 family)